MTPFRTEVEQAERRVVEAACATFRSTHHYPHAPGACRECDLARAAQELEALRAAICPTCGGTGRAVFGHSTLDAMKCRAGCQSGRAKS